ncbi:MAG: cytidine deaminase [Ignavibacteriae bacterium]|jgi:cytidine deaminase|nr:MAG: cytidine deaminase [Ignavibacteriota bacterium]
MDIELLNHAVHAARVVRERAYAPYSGFLVGAALVDEDGGLHVGCNMENASYGLTQCAERAALTAATAAGNRRITTCVIVTDSEHPVAPCGACRQVLAESNPQMRIISVTLNDDRKEWTLDHLLPSMFGPRDLLNDK